MIRRPPGSTRTDTHVPYPARFRSPLRRRPGRGRGYDGIEALEDRLQGVVRQLRPVARGQIVAGQQARSEEHTSEFQSLMRTYYAVFRLQKKNSTHMSPKHTHYYNNQ